MGHVEGLDRSYVRLDQDREIAEAYRDAMPNVSVYQVEDLELKKSVEELKQENVALKRRLNGQAAQMTEMAQLRSDLDELRSTIRQMLKKGE